jgi:transglutaminase-like putative cysteine protease
VSRLRIVHRTGFTYNLPAQASYNEARMLPAHSGDQFVLSTNLEISPSAIQHSYLDYWGTRVSTFEVLTPHTELSVTATSLVEVRPSEPPSTNITWDELETLADTSVHFVEHLRSTRLTAPHDEVVVMAAEARATGASPHDTALLIARAVHDRIEYQRGVTGVHSTGADAWTAGKGVCQDFAHVAIGALRSLGIPARSVSGYLHPKPQAPIGETVTGESHAWVEWFTGAWHGYDPTNMIDIGERHVLVARGRDYTDVSPLRGVYAGPSASSIFVRVEITREA